MFSVSSPESVGISSVRVRNFLNILNQRGMFMHSVLMARGDKLFCEAYYKPYTANDDHRMYSTTKSYIGIAICELAARGLISLDDRIIDYFPDKLPESVHPYLKAQTIRHMLAMQTCMWTGVEWYRNKIDDRVSYYFNQKPAHYPGTGYWYDSDGSFILGALIERITKKNVLDFLREVCLNEIGFSKTARCLKAPGGHSWGDSGLLCTPYDMLLFGRLIANNGEWNGKQLLDRDAVREAVGDHTDTYTFGIQGFSNRGYGYQIWHSYNDSIMFSGMHDQVMLYDKESDIIFVCTAGNPSGVSRELIISFLYNEIIMPSQTNALPEDRSEYEELKNSIAALEIPIAPGHTNSSFEESVNGKKFICKENKMGIAEFMLCFNDEGGELHYRNAQGDKTLAFGCGKNIVQQFPQLGYSKEVGGIDCDGNTYRCAVSAAWSQPQRLSIMVQVIDDYIGLLNISIGFNNGHAWLTMKKQAENFLKEYDGHADAAIEGMILNE